MPHVHWLLQSSRMDGIYGKKTLEDSFISVEHNYFLRPFPQYRYEECCDVIICIREGRSVVLKREGGVRKHTRL